MSPIHLQSPLRVLYRISVVPKPHVPRILFLHPTRGVKHAARNKRTTPKVDTKRRTLADDYTLDTAITSPWVNLVHADGRFETQISLRTALSSFDKTAYHLVQVAGGKADEAETSDPAHLLPTCRVISKADLRARQEHRLAAVRKQAKGVAVKIVELNWAIAPKDLQHRINQVQGFLSDGKRVELMMGPKRGGRRASAEEADAMLRTVRQAIDACQGSKEIRSEGQVGEVMMLVVQGKEMKKVDEHAETKREGG